jgi:hypothetical protein
MLFDRKYFENTIKVNNEFTFDQDFITRLLIEIFFFENLQMIFIAMKLSSPFLVSISVIGGLTIKLSMIFIINHIVGIYTGGSFLALLNVNGYFLINSFAKVYETTFVKNETKSESMSGREDSTSSDYSSAESVSSDKSDIELSVPKFKKISSYNPVELDPLYSKYAPNNFNKFIIEDRNKRILEDFKTYVPEALNDPEEIVNIFQLNKTQKPQCSYNPLEIDPLKKELEFNLKHPQAKRSSNCDCECKFPHVNHFKDCKSLVLKSNNH